MGAVSIERDDFAELIDPDAELAVVSADHVIRPV